jgi:SWI/SNF-related matrix-associated actin-dependent regulator 1 of chromatin subfamily A
MSLKYLKEFNNIITIAIVDEAHYLKNPQAKRTELLTPLLCRCNHVFLLTGTPAFAKPKELFSLISIIRPDIFYSFREYGARYCDPRPSRFHKGTVN